MGGFGDDDALLSVNEDSFDMRKAQPVVDQGVFGQVNQDQAPGKSGQPPVADDGSLDAALMQDFRTGQGAANRLRDQIIPAFQTLIAGGKPNIAMPELEAGAALRRIEQSIKHGHYYIDDPVIKTVIKFKPEVNNAYVFLKLDYDKLKPQVDRLSKQYADKVKAEQAAMEAAKHPAPPPPKAPAIPPHSYSDNVAAPPHLDFGKVAPGTVGRTQGAMFNLSSAQCGCSVSYSGDPAISITHGPTRLAAKGEYYSLDDQSIKLAFNAPPHKGSHYGTITVDVWWWGGPPADKLTIPVVAHSMNDYDETHDEQVARQNKEAEEDAAHKRSEAAQAKELHDLEEFEKKNPRIETDAFRSAAVALQRTMDQFEQMQLSGIETAKDEVLKYKKRPPPAESTLMFDLAMLALDIASAGIAGYIGKALEIGLKEGSAGVKRMVEGTLVKTTVEKMGKEVGVRVASDATRQLITDSVKESIKGSSKLARKNGLTPNHHPSGPNPTGPSSDGSSTDPRIAFFQFQRDGVILSQTDRTTAFLKGLRLLHPLLAKDPAAAVASVEGMTAALQSQLAQTSNTMAHESVKAWVNHISNNHLSVNHAGSVESKGIDEAKGVVDIGFQAPYGPRGQIIVKKAILRGVSNAVANRFQNLRLLDAGLPVRVYGMPSGNYAELAVTMIRNPGGHIDWVDETNGSAPATYATWIKQAGGAKYFLENVILNRSLTEHGVHLETDQDPSLEGG